VAEDRLFELAQLGARLQPQLIAEHPACVAVRVERIRLPAGGVEGAHQLTAESLAQRVLFDQALQLGNEARTLAERELRLDPLLDRLEPKLLQPPDLRLRERLERQILQCRPTPQRQGGPQLVRPIAPLRPSCVRDEPLEPGEIEPLRVDAQHVAPCRGREHVAPERLAQVRDVVLQRGGCALRRLRPPDLVDQALAGDELVRV
jgi:hypothetical protein